MIKKWCLLVTRLSWITVFLHFLPVYCQTIPAHAVGLKEQLISVDLAENKKQVGVYSSKIGTDQPTKLAVLLPGAPSVVRPIVENNLMMSSQLTANFLIRARRFIVDENVASLIVDCPSDSGDYCSSAYQASKQRQLDIEPLIAEVKKLHPSIQEVWLVGTSMGTVSSSFMPQHNPAAYAGAIHTAFISDPKEKKSYKELADFDYKKITIPQFLIHHTNDPCPITTYSSAKKIAEKFNLPLLSVSGGAGFQGPVCESYTEHGFRGKEKEVMNAINAIIKTGKLNQLEIN